MLEIRGLPLKKAWKVFLRLQRRIYRNDSNWVPPLVSDRKKFLNPEKNPFFEHATAEAFAVYDDAEPVGMLFAFVDHDYVDFHNEKAAHFGFFECEDNPEAAALLMEAAEELARKNGMKVVRGPYNFSTNHECGLLVDGFDGPPVILMTYNPPYYRTLLENLGYTKAMDLLAYYIEARPVPEGLKEAVHRVQQKKKITVRNPSMKRFNEELEIIKLIYNDAWSRNWGFVPLRDNEFNFIAKDLKFVLDPELVFIAEIEGEPAGFALSLPDFNQVLIHMNGRLFPLGVFKALYYRKRINLLRVFALGVRKQDQDVGLGAVLYFHTWEAALKKGYKGAEMSWILEDNEPMRRGIELAGGRVYRTYRIYEKQV